MTSRRDLTGIMVIWLGESQDSRTVQVGEYCYHLHLCIAPAKKNNNFILYPII